MIPANREILFTLAGLALLVGAFFAAAKAIGAVAALIFIITTTDFLPDPSGSGFVMNTLNSTYLATAVHNLLSFVILLIGGKWMLSRPKLIQGWIVKSGKTENPNPLPTDAGR